MNCILQMVFSLSVYPHFLVVPSDRESLQTDEAVRVHGQLDGVPVQSHLVHVGTDVVTGVTFAERLVRYR